MPRIRSVIATALLFVAVTALAQTGGKRPLTHADYDIWNNITPPVYGH